MSTLFQSKFFFYVYVGLFVSQREDAVGTGQAAAWGRHQNPAGWCPDVTEGAGCNDSHTAPIGKSEERGSKTTGRTRW